MARLTSSVPSVLEIDPPDTLVFKGPFDDIVESHLHLHNPTNKTVLFTIKTTAPKSYTVNPNRGILKPGCSQNSTVTFCPGTLQKGSHLHKFLIMAVYAPHKFEPSEADKVWKATPSQEIMTSKVGCSFIEKDHALPQSSMAQATNQEMIDLQQSTHAAKDLIPMQSVLSTEKENVASKSSGTETDLAKEPSFKSPCSEKKDAALQNQNKATKQELQEEVERLQQELQQIKTDLQSKKEMLRNETVAKESLAQTLTETTLQLTETKILASKADLECQTLRTENTNVISHVATMEEELQQLKDENGCLKQQLCDAKSVSDVMKTSHGPCEDHSNLIMMTGRLRSFEIPLSDLEFGDQLGQGGFGAVFRGKWKSKNMTVALKKTLAAPEVADVNMMGLLGQHPNIVSFYAYATDHPHTVSVLELAENGSLNDYLYKASNKPDLAQSLNWAQDIAYGMAHLHNHDIVHRDLKSHNILFSTRMVAMVSDYGTARFLSHTTEATKTGTLRWMAPEVINEEKFNKKCDVYSYAMVLLELMEHKVPYDGKSDFTAATLATDGQRPALGDKMPGYIRSLVESCWAQDYTERPFFYDIVIAMETKTYP